jgi:hypothetical protein
MTENQSNKAPDIEKLIADLSSSDREERENARLALVSIGHPAVMPLVKQLRSPEKWTRWEAAKTLAEMRDPSAAPILVDSLTNSDPNIRWLAAEGLIALGRMSLAPLLSTLTQYSGSILLAEGAHHVLHDLYTGGVHEGEYEYEPLHPLTKDMKALVKPVLDSLETTGSVILTPEYAKVALDDLKRSNK